MGGQFGDQYEQVKLIVPRGQSKDDAMMVYEQIKVVCGGICSPFLNFLLGRVASKN